MRLLNPAGLLGLLLAVPIVLLYMLRLHRQNVPVPSLLLWEAVLADRHANRPWQKLRRNWLLFVQLLVLLALVFALARPAIPAPLTFHGQTIVLLDVSASMQATTGHGDVMRFAEALRALRNLAAMLNPGDRVSLIAAGPTPRLLLQSGDASALRRALDDVAPVDGAVDWHAAAVLAAGLATGDDVTTLLVTDAAFDEVLPSLPGTVRLITVGQEAVDNAGLVAFALRRTAEGLMAFAQVYNAGTATSRIVALYADGVLVERRVVNLPEWAMASLSFDGLPALAWAEVRLEDTDAGTDALAVDDRAWVALAASAGGRVLLVTPGNRFLAQALSTLPDLALSQTATLADDSEAASENAAYPEYAVIVADGSVTTTLPTTNLWLIAPGAGSPCGEPGAVVTPTASVHGQWSHPLLSYVDWADVHVASARAYTLPADAEILVEAATGPLLWAVERPGQRIACMAFDLRDSDLPLRLAFPILTANLTGWLMPQISTEPVLSLPSGSPWVPSLPAVTTAATLVTPDGRHLPLTLDAPQMVETAAGLYRIEAETPAGPVVSYVALSLLDAIESDLRPREVRVGDGVIPPAEEVPGWRDLGRWGVGMAIVLLLLEAILWWGPSWRRKLVKSQSHRLLSSKRQTPDAKLQNLKSKIQNAAKPPFLLRLVLVGLLLLALFGLSRVRRTRDLAVVFLLDRSASTRSVWDAQVAFVEDALSRKAPQDRAALVVFAGDAWVDRPLSTASALPGIATLPRIDATRIEEAVRLALALIPEGAPGRLVVLTDGLETSGLGAFALQEARTRGVDVQLVQTGSGTPGAEAWIADISLPARVYPGDRIPALVEIGSTIQQNVGFAWTVLGQTGFGEVDALGEETGIAFLFMADEPGFVAVRVCIEPELDTFTQNNCADGWVLVQGAPRVLVVGALEDREDVAYALESAGLAVEQTTSDALPLTAQSLADYAGVVLVNTPARSFAPQSLNALRAFVRDLGGGLVAVGGPQSYGVGGWLGTPLEEALPVQMQVQDPTRFPPMVMAVVIDKSGSMGVQEAGMTKIRLAAEAAIRVAETLNDADTLAVVAYDDRPADTIGPAPMTERGLLVAQLRRLQVGGGGIYVRESLSYAADLLRSVTLSPGQQRHILLLADGADAEHQENVPALVQSLAEEGVTVSVVAIGSGGDVPFLKNVAEIGNGRFYLTQRAADLPAIFTEETARAKRSYIVERTFYPAPLTPWLPVADITVAPPLHGYVATTPKGAAQVVWEALEGDPLLAVWQYGLGRSVAWTSDATGRWAAGWVDWEGFADFWSAVVRAVLPSSADADLALRVLPDEDDARVIVDVVNSEAEEPAYVYGLSLKLNVAPSLGEGEAQTISLVQRAPGRYEGKFTLQDRSAVLLRLFGDRDLVTGWAALASPEYIPADAGAAVARLVAQGDAIQIEDSAQVFVHDLQGLVAGQLLMSLFVLLVALAWPVDIAWRRLALTRGDVVRFFVWLRARLPELWPKALRRRPQERHPPAGTAASLAATLRRKRTTVAQEAQPVVTDAVLSGKAQDGEGIPSAKTLTAPPARGAEGDAEPETLAARLKRRVRE
ncbi:MAG: VWA domain-containing protein [Anaerolineae bacterium]|nr:VWA domain-containing protein [Anaerolineae bacterium]